MVYQLGVFLQSFFLLGFLTGFAQRAIFTTGFAVAALFAHTYLPR